jgi:hypothetical protein
MIIENFVNMSKLINCRLYAVASILGRQLKENTEIGGYEIPKGVKFSKAYLFDNI